MDPAASPAVSADPRLARVIPLLHPQGCRGYLLVDPATRRALALDVHLDQVAETASILSKEGWDLKWVVDSHTHADHPSGAARLADWFGATRLAHEKGGHRGVKHHPKDGETLELGETGVRFLHAPGHTPDHLVLTVPGAVFTGDTILIGSVARADFIGGDPGVLHDSIRRVLAEVPASTDLYPGHDYRGRAKSTVAEEQATNPWLRLPSREEFVRRLSANRPPRPANMDALLRLNREGIEVAARVSVADLRARVEAGGASGVIDVRTAMEVASEGIPGALNIPLDEIERRADEVRTAPAPRLIVCQQGTRSQRAQKILDALGVLGLSVVEGGIDAFKQAGGKTVGDAKRIPLERQVRVAAGGLVLLSAVLALLLDPLFGLLAAFVGAGLVFSGLTGACGMALVLVKAPWNRTLRGTGAAPAGGCSAGGCSADLPPSTGGCAAEPPPGISR